MSVAILFRFSITIRKMPTSSKVTVTALTDAKVIQPFRITLRKLSLTWRRSVLIFIAVLTPFFVPDDDAAFYSNHPVLNPVDDILVMRCHDNCGAAHIN